MHTFMKKHISQKVKQVKKINERYFCFGQKQNFGTTAQDFPQIGSEADTVQAVVITSYLPVSLRGNLLPSVS